MTEKNVINMMQQDIRIPDIVQRKADIAFEKIMAESKEAGEEDKEGLNQDAGHPKDELSCWAKS